MVHRQCYRRAWPARDILKPSDITALTRHSSLSKILTILGAIKEAKVSRFSGGGPPLDGPMITNVSPETTSFTVPRSHPVAILICQSLRLTTELDKSVGRRDHQIDNGKSQGDVYEATSAEPKFRVERCLKRFIF